QRRQKGHEEDTAKGEGTTSRRGKLPEQDLGATEPGTLAAFQITRQGGLLVQNFAGHLARFPGLTLLLEQVGVIVLRLSERGALDDLLKQTRGFFLLSQLRLGLGQQSRW